MTREEFNSAATEIYGDKYDLQNVTENAIKYDTNVPIKCNKHGIFYTTPYCLLNGLLEGCFECYKEKYWGDKEKGL